MNQKKRLEFIEPGDLKKVLWTMGIPTMIGMIITALYNVVDAYFVSGLGITATIILLLLTFLTLVLTFVGATDTILNHADHYARIIILSSLLTVFNVTMNNLFTAEGKPQKTMMIMTAGALLNIVLDPIFIYKLNLGVDGAACATAISHALSSVLYLSLILRKKNFIRINLRNTKWYGEIFEQIFKIVMPMFFGLKRVLYTQPAADALTIILSRYFVFKNKNMLKGGKLI